MSCADQSESIMPNQPPPTSGNDNCWQRL